MIWTVSYEIDEGTGVTYTEFDTTDDHPWASIDGTWLRTDELKPGMEIQRAHGVPARVMSVVETDRTEQTYNLEVADFHTYFVGEAWVWVHNAYCNPLRSRLGSPHWRTCPACGRRSLHLSDPAVLLDRWRTAFRGTSGL